MRAFLIGSLAAVATGGALTVTASAKAEQQTYSLGDFDGVSAVGPHKVIVEVGPGASVRAEGPRESLDRMKVTVENGELKIVPKREHWSRDEWEAWHDTEPATYYVTLPRLEAAAIVGSGTMSIDRVAGKRFAGTIAGSARLEIAQLSVEDGKFSVAGSGNLVARGAIDHAQVSVAGSGTIEGRGLTSQTASVSVAGSGEIDLTVKDSAQVSSVGSGEVAIAGGAQCTVTGFGSGHTRCNGVVVENQPSRWGMWAAPPAPPAPPATWRWDADRSARDEAAGRRDD